MAFANSSVSDIIATNIQSRTGELADNVTNNNALLRRLKDRGNVKTFSGGNVILQEIMYSDSATNNTNSYSGYEVLNVSQTAQSLLLNSLSPNTLLLLVSVVLR